MKKRSIKIGAHSTSITLEDDFWNELLRIAHENNKSLNMIVTDIDAQRHQDQNLSSAIRVFILKDLKAKNS